MEKIKEIDVKLKSEPMNEMLAHPPALLIRSGNGLILIVLFIVLGLTLLISYPDEIICQVSVTSSQPPIELSNPVYAQINSLNVTDGQHVKQGQLLVEFDNQANPDDVQKAITFVTQLKKQSLQKGMLLPEAPTNLQLGVFQEMWEELNTSILEWNNTIEFDPEYEQINVIQREISLRKKLILLSEKGNKKSDNQVINVVQSQKEQSVQNLIQLNSLQRELIKLKQAQRLNQENRINQLTASMATLNNKLSDWKKATAFVAPTNGKVFFYRILQKNKRYKPGEASIVVVPFESNYFALATISSEGARKVRIGQKTMIELTDFPKGEFGILNGVVAQITQVKKGGTYQIKIRLPKQLTTSYGKELPFKTELKGSVKIMTRNKRLFTRLFENLSSQF